MESTVENRVEPRVEANESASVQRINPFSSGRLSARVLNRSKGGICIASATFLPRGGEIQVLLSRSQLFGKIKYCVPAPEGFRVGVAVSQTVNAGDAAVPKPSGYPQRS